MNIQEAEKHLNDLELQLLKEIAEQDNSEESQKNRKELAVEIERFKKEAFSNLSPWDRVYLARKLERPNAFYYINNLFHDFIEMHGDRHHKDDPSIVGGIAFFESMPVTIIAQIKGKSIEENIKRNFGMPNPEGYRKSIRLMKQAEKFKRPIITFIDTPGAYPGIEAETNGQGEAIARNLFEMMQISVPIISIIIGEAGSGGALALCASDRIWMLENSYFSILSPEGFASILWKDSTKAKEASEVMKLTANDLFDLKVIDKVIKEPLGGIHKYPFAIIEQLKRDIRESICELIPLSQLKEDKPDYILNKRYEKYRNIGVL